ncbi:MAG TPA: hypothetical protein VI729_11355 [Anaerolineales bacterium]|nr:hypothetical protein [Anaerolineales bacterium]
MNQVDGDLTLTIRHKLMAANRGQGGDRRKGWGGAKLSEPQRDQFALALPVSTDKALQLVEVLLKLG